MDNLLEYINKDIKPLNCKDKIADAQDLLLELPYTHFPVIDNGVYIIFSNKQLYGFFICNVQLRNICKEKMVLRIACCQYVYFRA